MSITIGKIIKSNSHIDYVCQVHGPGEVSMPPRPEEYALGTWVGMPVGAAPSGEDRRASAVRRAPDLGSTAVGLIYDTQLYNPDYGMFGPRLSSQSQLEVFSPDYLNETATLLGILVVGQMQDCRRTASGLCPVAPQVGAPVEKLDEEAIRAFHRDGEELELSYYTLMLSIQTPVMPPLLLGVLGDLTASMPEHASTLNALRTSLSWKTRVDLAR